MVEELLLCFCCFERNSLFGIGCVKGCSKHVSSVVAVARYCKLTPCRFHPFSKHLSSVYSYQLWKGKTGSICHFAGSPVLQCLEVPRHPDAGKNSTKSVIVTPLFVSPIC